MARMHSRKKGKAGSSKPLKRSAPVWIRHTPAEIEMIIAKLSKEGKSTSEIGIVLRDSYGVPDVKSVLNKKISKVLAEKKLSPVLPEDLRNLILKSMNLRKHMENNKQDMTSKRGLQLTESKVKRLVSYYKDSGKLPSDWKYDAKSVKLFVE